MLASAWFWHFVLAFVFSGILEKMSDHEGAGDVLRALCGLELVICLLALAVFDIMGFWTMDAWYDPFLLGFLASIFGGIGRFLLIQAVGKYWRYLAYASLVAAPVFTVFTFCALPV